ISDATLVGSSHSADTLRIKEFFTRNGHPYTYIDLERDTDVQSLLDHLHVSLAETPVVICRGETVLRNPTNREIANCLCFNEAVDRTRVRDLVIAVFPISLVKRKSVGLKSFPLRQNPSIPTT